MPVWLQATLLVAGFVGFWLLVWAIAHSMEKHPEEWAMVRWEERKK